MTLLSLPVSLKRDGERALTRYCISNEKYFMYIIKLVQTEAVQFTKIRSKSEYDIEKLQYFDTSDRFHQKSHRCCFLIVLSVKIKIVMQK